MWVDDAVIGEKRYTSKSIKKSTTLHNISFFITSPIHCFAQQFIIYLSKNLDIFSELI